jgi:hypothetical protein
MPEILMVVSIMALMVTLGTALSLFVYWIKSLTRAKHQVQIRGCLDETHLPDSLRKRQSSQRFPSFTLAFAIGSFAVFCWSSIRLSAYMGAPMTQAFSTVTSQLQTLNSYKVDNPATQQ